MTAAERRGAILSCAGTNRGKVRSLNEDAFLAEFPVFIVADGMGGHEGGETASAAAIAVFQELVGRQDVTAAEIPALVERAQQSVRNLVAQDGSLLGAGCTLSGVVAVRNPEGAPQWLVLNVGDSRVYLHYEKQLQQLTKDHSLVQEMLDAGALDGLTTHQYPPRNIITRAIGGDDFTADYWVLPIKPGERILVCSDGLTGEVSDAEIEAALSQEGPVEAPAASLIDSALAAGGRDNITLIIVEVEGAPDGARPQADVFWQEPVR